MGCCETHKRPKPNINFLCQINSNNGLNGFGFFTIIPFSNSNCSLKVLITSNLIITSKDLTPGNKIKFNLNNNKRNIIISIDNTRKCYSSDKYGLSIIEIKKEDNFDDINFIEVDNENDTYQKEICLIYFTKSRSKEYQNIYFGQIVRTFDNNIFAFTLTNNYRDININEALGCPILNNSIDKIKGINISLTKENDNYFFGMFLSKAIEDFYKQFSDSLIESNLVIRNKEINIIFHDIDYNKDYIVKCSENAMFGELIVYFYLSSGLDFDEQISFFLDEVELPCYSSEYLINLNIKDNDKIVIRRKPNIAFQLINIIFLSSDRNTKILIHAIPFMKTKELIMKFCQVFRYPFREIKNDYKFMFLAKTITLDEKTLQDIGLKNSSEIDFLHLNNFTNDN